MQNIVASIGLAHLCSVIVNIDDNDDDDDGAKPELRSVYLFIHLPDWTIIKLYATFIG